MAMASFSAYTYHTGANLYAVGIENGPKFAITHGAILFSLKN